MRKVLEFWSFEVWVQGFGVCGLGSRARGFILLRGSGLGFEVFGVSGVGLWGSGFRAHSVLG